MGLFWVRHRKLRHFIIGLGLAGLLFGGTYVHQKRNNHVHPQITSEKDDKNSKERRREHDRRLREIRKRLKEITDAFQDLKNHSKREWLGKEHIPSFKRDLDEAFEKYDKMTDSFSDFEENLQEYIETGTEARLLNEEYFSADAEWVYTGATESEVRDFLEQQALTAAEERYLRERKEDLRKKIKIYVEQTEWLNFFAPQVLMYLRKFEDTDLTAEEEEDLQRAISSGERLSEAVNSFTLLVEELFQTSIKK